MLKWIARFFCQHHRQGLYYIGGSETLPPPLNGEEEKAALAALERGDEGAKQTLVEHNLRLVVYIARRFENVATPWGEVPVKVGSARATERRSY